MRITTSFTPAVVRYLRGSQVFGDKRFFLENPPKPKPPLPFPIPIPDNGFKKTVTVHAPISNYDGTNNRIYVIGLGGRKFTSASSHSGSWCISIDFSGDYPWITQLEATSWGVSGVMGASQIGIIRAKSEVFDPPHTIIYTELNSRDGFVISEASFPISTNYQSLGRSAIWTESHVLFSPLFGTTIYSISNGRCEVFTDISHIPLPPGYNNNYTVFASAILSMKKYRDGYYLLITSEARRGTETYQFFTVAYINSSGRLNWKPQSFGRPLSSYQASGADVGIDGYFYVVYSISNSISGTYKTEVFGIKDDQSLKPGWPKIISVKGSTGIKTDPDGIYISSLRKYKEIEGTVGLDRPIFTSLDYRGNESSLANGTYHVEGENWQRAMVLPFGQFFFTVGYVVLNSYSPQERHGIFIRKYDKYGNQM